MKTTRIGGSFAAEIHDLALNEESLHRCRDDLHRAYLDHKVIVLRGQTITTEVFAEFGTIFGKAEVHHVRAMRHPQIPVLTMLSNQSEPGRNDVMKYFGDGWRRLLVQTRDRRRHHAVGDRDSRRRRSVIGVEGMDAVDSDPLIDRLLAHVTRPTYVYRHRWRPNDIVVWDNRSLLHSATTKVLPAHQVRRMLRITTTGSTLVGVTPEAGVTTVVPETELA